MIWLFFWKFLLKIVWLNCFLVKIVLDIGVNFFVIFIGEIDKILIIMVKFEICNLLFFWIKCW